ncbi:MAG: hydroxypyruvate isomerase [Rhodothermales bacterium]
MHDKTHELGCWQNLEIFMHYSELSRRQLLAGTAALGLAGSLANAADSGPAVTKGRIRQSVMGWCFKPMKPEALITLCKSLGMHAIEGISTKAYPAAKEAGLDISLVGSHGFQKGPSDSKNHDVCEKKLNSAIDLAAAQGYKRVITFTGMRVDGLDDATMADNCIALWKRVLAHAEKSKITLCLEHLNSRDDSHPMKGHPGYFGDDVDFCAELINRVGSPSLKLLFDCYHVQIMNGDVIRRIRQYKDIIGHYHTAGNPGRAELDETQEMQYPPIMRAILETGYHGYVAQEFIPTWEDKAAALRHAVALCDV